MRVLVIGDSMVKYFQNYLPSQLSDYDVHVKSFSGIKIEQLSREILKLNCQYDYFVIHVGTNNWRDDIDLYKKKYDNLFREVLRFNPHCKVIVSPLIMRNTNLHLSFQEQVANSILVKSINKHFTIINSELAKLCEATGFCFCRSQSWIGYICRDGVHLNYAGNRRLANFFVQHIRKVINKVICVSSVPNILSPKDFPSLTPLCAVQFPSVFPQRISLHSPNGTSSYRSSWLPRDDEPAVPAHDCESSLQAHNCKPPPLPTCDSGPSLQICGHGFPVPTPDFPEPAFNSLGKTCDCRSPSPTPCGLSKKACDHEFSGRVHELSRKDHGLSGKAYDYELRRKANDYGSSGKAYDRELSRKATDRGLSEKTGNHGWSKNTPAHKLFGKIDDQQSFRKAQNYGLPKKMNDHKLPENLYGHKSLLQSSDWTNFHRTRTSRRSLLQTTSFPSPEIPYISAYPVCPFFICCFLTLSLSNHPR